MYPSSSPARMARVKAGRLARAPYIRTSWWWVRITPVLAEADAFAMNVRPILDSLGGISAQAKARELNARRVATAGGGKWSATTVLRVLARTA